jgi:hypothetical protein
MAEEKKDNKQSLEGKVVMFSSSGSLIIGRHSSNSSPTLDAPYLKITGGSMHPTDIRLETNPRTIDGTPKLYTPGGLEAYLIGNCHGVDNAQLVVSMMDGYANKSPEKTKGNDPII